MGGNLILPQSEYRYRKEEAVIKYALKCSNDHLFDGWFGNSMAFDDQRDRGLISCPSCGTSDVDKTLMAPSVTGTKMQKADTENADAPQTAALPAHLPGNAEILPAIIPEPLVHGDATMQAVVAKMRELREWVEANTDNVGDRFADEARKIHFGETRARGIIGKATFEEAQELIDDGIDFLPLPALPEDNN